MHQPSKIRRQIVHEAARLIFQRQETQYHLAKMKAAKRVQRGWVKQADLPANWEIRDEVQAMSRIFEGERRFEPLEAMRYEALRILRLLERFRPRVVGNLLDGEIRRDSPIEIHAFSDSISTISASLEATHVSCKVHRNHIEKPGSSAVQGLIEFVGPFRVEISVRLAKYSSWVPKSIVSGRPIERMSLAEFDAFLNETYGNETHDQLIVDSDNAIDPLTHLEALLLPLEDVKQDASKHPEGDALFHSLQVFELARCNYAYDEDFLLAALLHDVGKAVDPHASNEAGLELLQEAISERTRWFIEHLPDAWGQLTGSLGARALRRLKASDDFDQLMQLARFDREGRKPGGDAPTLDEAINYLRELAVECGDW